MKKTGRPGKPIVIEGVRYASITEAALMTGISRTRLYQKSVRQEFNVNGEGGTHLQHEGVWFKSEGELARHLNVSKAFIQKAVALKLFKTRNIGEIA